MKIGVCLSLREVAAGLPAAAKSFGFDYIELPLSAAAALDEGDFAELLAAVERSGLPCEACNIMFPGTLRLTGPAVDFDQVHAYLELALGRAGRMGVKSAVFGSAGARNVPEGFPKEQAWLQLVEMLRAADPLAAQNGLALAIEPLNHTESNILNSGAEGFALARLVERPNIGLLLDYYHIWMDGEHPGIAVTARNVLRHAHFADPEARCYPVEMKAHFRDFFDALKAAGYDSRVSIEAAYSDFAADAPRALAVMRSLV